jgi:hypothetical protein
MMIQPCGKSNLEESFLLKLALNEAKIIDVSQFENQKTPTHTVQIRNIGAHQFQDQENMWVTPDMAKIIFNEAIS